MGPAIRYHPYHVSNREAESAKLTEINGRRPPSAINGSRWPPLVDATVLPSLFYAAPVWCSALCARSTRLAPIDRVLRLCGIGIMGLHRTVSGDAARMVAGLIPTDFHLRERVVDFYLRHLAYGEDLTIGASTHPSRHFGPVEILQSELRSLSSRTAIEQLPLSHFTRVERRHFWYTDPSSPPWEPTLLVLPPGDAVHYIREARDSSS